MIPEPVKGKKFFFCNQSKVKPNPIGLHLRMFYLHLALAHAFLCLAPVAYRLALGTGCMFPNLGCMISCAWLLIVRFPVCGTSCMFTLLGTGCTHTVPHAWHCLYVFVSSFDWTEVILCLTNKAL